MSKSRSTGLSKLDELCVQTIRFLAADSVQRANSGHPGMPMGMAAAGFVLWTRHLRHNPANPQWANRDRFVLSAGHGCMLLYALQHLSGYQMSLDDLKNFRQLGSKTPGHPEFNPALGIEVTTGPLGQGISNAVGMGIAQKYLANYFNRKDFNIFDYNIYVIAGDGCLEEGISSESGSLAGHLGLDNLIAIYDDNRITIDGDTKLAFTEDVAARYEAYGWYVQQVIDDGNDMEAFEKALVNAENEKKRPSIIKLRTHIGFGSPTKQDTAAAHGAPLGEDDIRRMKAAFGWDAEKTFYVPDEVAGHTRKCVEKAAALESVWSEMFDEYSKAYPQLAGEFKMAAVGKPAVDIEKLLPEFKAGDAITTRKASGAFLDSVMPKWPFVLGGSADLTDSNKTKFKGAENFGRNSHHGRYIHFGVREHAMGAILNGLSVGGFLRAYGGTFLVFSDYMRASIRMAALSGYPSIFVFTHDSIGLGEDGPTHQPVEQLASLRAIPNLKVFRPADANETVQVWKYVLEHTDGPAVIVLTRQKVTTIDQKKYNSAEAVSRGAYVLLPVDEPDVLLLATGSEVDIALCAAEALSEEGIKAQVISMPCWKLFDKQSQEYKDSVLLPQVKLRIGIEAGVKQGWEKWLGERGEFIGLSGFGVSAPGEVCFEHFGITMENVIETAKKLLKQQQ